jgi:hypothetical protein
MAITKKNKRVVESEGVAHVNARATGCTAPSGTAISADGEVTAAST